MFLKKSKCIIFMFDERNEGGNDFNDKELSMEEAPFTENVIRFTDLVYNINKTYSLRVLLEQCKCIVKENTIKRLFHFDFDSCYDRS